MQFTQSDPGQPRDASRHSHRELAGSGVTDWASRVARQFAREIAWRRCGPWADEFEPRLAAALRLAMSEPYAASRGAWLKAKADQLLLPVRPYLEAHDCFVLEQRLAGALAVAIAQTAADA